jgi:hypothetical protein
MAGVGGASLWYMRTGRRFGRLAVGRVASGVLAAWLIASSLAAHPDYLAYFNETASARPEHFLLNSDLDYGQDVGRLADTLRARGIDSVTVYLFAFRDDSLLSGPSHVAYPDWRKGSPPPVTGWVAASSLIWRAIPGIPWLRGRPPAAHVGRSIDLFYVPPAAKPPRATAP